MVMKMMREGALAGFLKYVILGLIALSVIGMVLMDFSGAFRNDISGNRDVAIVNGEPLSLQDFDIALSQSLQSTGLSPQQAYQMGYVNEILAQQVRKQFAIQEAEKLGISLSKEQIQKTIVEAISPLVQEGKTLQETLEQALDSRRLSEKQFVEIIRRDVIADIMSLAIQDSFTAATPELVKDMIQFQGQTRNIDLVLIPDDSITEIKPATQDQIRKLYDSYKDNRYKIPEYRSFKIGVLQREKLKQPAPVTDLEIETYYKDNLKNFEVSEQKILTQVLTPDEAEAKKIADLALGGKTLEDAFHAVMGEKASGLTKDMRLEVDVMFPEMKKAIESTKIGGVVGPIKTPLGHHIFRLDGIIPPMTRPLAEVKESLRSSLMEEKKIQEIYGIATALEDHFAAGGTFANAKQKDLFTTSDIPLLDETGLSKDGADIFKTHDKLKSDTAITEIKDVILKEGFGIVQEDSKDQARIIDLPDRNIAVLELAQVEQSTAKAYDAVRDEIAREFEADQKSAANKERAQKIIEDIKAGKTSLSKVAESYKTKVQSLDKIGLSGALIAPLNEEIRTSLFKEPVGAYLEFQPEKATAIVHIKGYDIPKLTPEQEKMIPMLLTKAAEDSKNEAFIMYLGALGEKYQAKINDALLKRAYGQQAQNTGAP